MNTIQQFITFDESLNVLEETIIIENDEQALREQAERDQNHFKDILRNL